MHGLRLFNMVLVGAGFSVAQVDLDDFDLPGGKPQPRLRLPVVVQGGAGEFTLEVTPDRFQITAESSKATQFRVQAMQDAVRTFVRDYTSRKGVVALGHNFVGAFPAPGAGAASYLEQIAWSTQLTRALGDGASAMGVSVRLAPPGASVGGQLKLEPLAEDASQVFYEVNISFGQFGGSAPVAFNVDEAIDDFHSSYTYVSELIERLRVLT